MELLGDIIIVWAFVMHTFDDWFSVQINLKLYLVFLQISACLTPEIFLDQIIYSSIANEYFTQSLREKLGSSKHIKLPSKQLWTCYERSVPWQLVIRLNLRYKQSICILRSTQTMTYFLPNFSTFHNYFLHNLHYKCAGHVSGMLLVHKQ